MKKSCLTFFQYVAHNSHFPKLKIITETIPPDKVLQDILSQVQLMFLSIFRQQVGRLRFCHVYLQNIILFSVTKNSDLIQEIIRVFQHVRGSFSYRTFLFKVKRDITLRLFVFLSCDIPSAFGNFEAYFLDTCLTSLRS